MANEPNLIVTGFMGTGKTTVGQELARRLGLTFVDTDELIESRHGPISRIFEEEGEASFREIERSTAKEVGSRGGQVIATGGGMLLDPENLAVLGKSGRIFCLVASAEEIYRRAMDDTLRKDRPLLQAEDAQRRIVELLNERDAVYRRLEQVDTDGRSAEAVAEEIVRRWRIPHDR